MKAQTAPKTTVWHQLYFVLASLLGLLCIVIGLSTFVNTLLTSTVFKVTEQRYQLPPQPPIDVEGLTQDQNLDDAQRQALTQWQLDYQNWQEEQQNYSWEEQDRKRSFSWSLALLLTGAPVFALHAPVVFGWSRKG